MKIKEVIVVEGINDAKHLEDLLGVDTLYVKGLGIDQKTIELVRAINEKRGVIVFTDPDHPGERIRAKLNGAIPGLKNAFIIKEKAKTTKKVGVEHADKKDIEEALDHLLTYCESQDTIDERDLLELGLIGDRRLRDRVSDYYHLGRPNAKTFKKRLNMLGVKSEEIREVICKISSPSQR